MSPRWLRAELLRTDHAIDVAERRGHDVMAYVLSEYRDVIAETRSAVLRSCAVPEWRRCRICGRLIDENPCPYCVVTWDRYHPELRAL